VLLHVLGVDLRDDQGHIGVHAEGAGVVHEHRARLDDGRGKLLGDIVLRRAQHDVHTLKGRVTGQLHGDIVSLPVDGLPHRALGGQQVQLADGEVPLGQHLHHFAAYRAGRAQNSNFILFHSDYSFIY